MTIMWQAFSKLQMNILNKIYTRTKRSTSIPVMKKGTLLNSGQRSQKPFICNKSTAWLKGKLHHVLFGCPVSVKWNEAINSSVRALWTSSPAAKSAVLPTPAASSDVHSDAGFYKNFRLFQFRFLVSTSGQPGVHASPQKQNLFCSLVN